MRALFFLFALVLGLARAENLRAPTPLRADAAAAEATEAAALSEQHRDLAAVPTCYVGSGSNVILKDISTPFTTSACVSYCYHDSKTNKYNVIFGSATDADIAKFKAPAASAYFTDFHSCKVDECNKPGTTDAADLSKCVDKTPKPAEKAPTPVPTQMPIRTSGYASCYVGSGAAPVKTPNKAYSFDDASCVSYCYHDPAKKTYTVEFALVANAKIPEYTNPQVADYFSDFHACKTADCNAPNTANAATASKCVAYTDADLGLPVDEKSALYDLYSGTGGDKWTWDSDKRRQIGRKWEFDNNKMPMTRVCDAAAPTDPSRNIQRFRC